MALLLAACGGTQTTAQELPGAQSPEALAVIEVRLPADPYTPLGQVLPVLHELGGKVCGRGYRILDRRMSFSLASMPAYNPAVRSIRPVFTEAYEIVAHIECLPFHR